MTDYERDRGHALVLWTRADGSFVGFDYDEFGCVTATSTPDGVVSTERGGWGVPVRQVDAVGRVTEVEVDAFGNVVAVTDPLGARTTYGYEVRASGAVMTSVVDAAGARTEFDCDDAGRVIRTIDPDAAVWTATRNVFGDVVEVMDPLGEVTRWQWSSQGWLLGEDLPDGTRRSYTYNGNGHRTSVTDEAGNITRTEYVAFGHVGAQVDAQGGVLAQRFDTVFSPLVVTNPDGAQWMFTHDRDSRVVAEVDYNGARTEFTLDGVGRAVTTRDRQRVQ